MSELTDRLVEAAARALHDAWANSLHHVPSDEEEAEIVLAAALPLVADEVEALRERHFAEYGNEETGPRNYDWALTHTARLIREATPGREEP